MTKQNVQRILHLYGATSQAEILSFLRTQCVIEETEIERVMSDWREAAARFLSISNNMTDIPDLIEIEDIPEEFSAELRKVSEDPLFKNAFSMLPISFKVVELDRVVAAQRYVNLDYAKRLSDSIPEDPDMKFLIDFCLKKGPETNLPAELQLSPNVYSYKSESTDFRFIGGYPKKLTNEDIHYCLGGGQPVAALILFVGYGTPAVNVFHVGSRIILNNGFHRLFALKMKGVAKAPVVVQSISNWNLELPQVLVGLPTTYLVSAPRPSLLKDFVDTQISRELSMKSRDRSVQIQWNFNQVDIPK